MVFNLVILAFCKLVTCLGIGLIMLPNCVNVSTLSFAEVIQGNGKLIPQAVKLWVERYEKDPKPATAELLEMLFEVI